MKAIFWLSIFLGAVSLLKFVVDACNVWAVRRDYPFLGIFAEYEVKSLVFSIACFIVAFNIQ